MTFVTSVEGDVLGEVEIVQEGEEIRGKFAGE